MRKHGWFRPHVRGLTAISSTTLREGGGDIITSIFADGTDGFYFDFSKTDRLFQEAQAAATPADGAGENIGTGLESHGWNGLEVAALIASAAELRGNGTIGIIGTATAATYNTSTGAGTVTRVDVSNQSFVVLPTTAGLGYYVDIEAANTILIRDGGSGATNMRTVSAGDRVQIRIFPAFAGSYICSSSGSAAFTVHSFKLIPGNHGRQATTSAQPKWQAGGLARFDGTDDNLLTTLAPGSAASLVFDVTVPATLAATQVICGGTVGTSRCVLAVNTSGQLCAGVGTDATTTIVGSTDLRSSRAKVGLVFNGSLVKLFENAAEVYSAAQNGSAGSDALRLGASNNGGTAGSFWAGDTYKALAIKKALTAAQFAAITTKWGTS